MVLQDGDRSPQDFVDALNHKEMPKLGYRLVINTEGRFWEEITPRTPESTPRQVPADQQTRRNREKSKINQTR